MVSPKEFVNGDKVTCEAPNGSIDRFSGVTLVGERQVEATTGANQQVDGIAYTSAKEAGDHLNVVFRGLTPAKVAESASVNDDLTSSGSGGGELRTVDEAGGESLNSIRLRLFERTDSDEADLVMVN